MGAVLRVVGTQFDPDRFCSESSLEPCDLYRKGEQRSPRRRPDGETYKDSGMTLVLSDADFHEFARQIEEATAFLQDHKDALTQLSDFPGVESMTLDFGIARRDVLVQYDYLPPTLIRLAGELGLGIELSQYPIDADEEDSEPD